MKIEVRLFLSLAVFFALVGTVYAAFSHLHEPVGVVALYLTAAFAAMCGGFMWWTGRRLDARPDDNPDGEISDIEGEYGFFSPHSWWPIVLAGGCALLSFGVAVGWWWVYFSIPVLLIGVVGWTFEYFKGEHAI